MKAKEIFLKAKIEDTQKKPNKWSTGIDDLKLLQQEINGSLLELEAETGILNISQIFADCFSNLVFTGS